MTSIHDLPDRLYHYNCTLLRVVDGDTLDVLIDLGFDIQHKARIRLFDINAPEKRGSSRSEGLAAQDFLTLTLASRRLILQSNLYQPDSFGRVIGTIYYEHVNPEEPLETTWVNANIAMLTSNHAIPYE